MLINGSIMPTMHVMWDECVFFTSKPQQTNKECNAISLLKEIDCVPLFVYQLEIKMVLEEGRRKGKNCVLVLSLDLDYCNGEYRPPERAKSTTLQEPPPTEVVRPSFPPIILPTTIENDENTRPPPTSNDNNKETTERDDDVAALIFEQAFEEALARGKIYVVSPGLSEQEQELVVRLCGEKLRNKGTRSARCIEVFCSFCFLIIFYS
jgi:hypothetical protein